MYALIPLYILSPLIKRMIDSLSREAALYLVGLWVFFSCLLPTIAAFAPETYRPLVVLDGRYNLSVMAGYAGYFIVGYYLMKMRRRVPVRWLVLLLIVDTLIIALGTWWKTMALDTYSEVFKTYIQLFTVVMSVALFLICKETMRGRTLGRTAGWTVKVLTPLAFGVYLLHNLLVDLFARLTGWSPAGSIPLMIAYYLVVLAASILIIAVLWSIKPLCWLFTGQRFAGWRYHRGPR
jgi:surface polysaccharide O-acyltransferase-like enzyme